MRLPGSFCFYWPEGFAIVILSMKEPRMPQKPNWQKIRKKLFPGKKSVLYFNTGSLGVCPPEVTEKVFETWKRIEENPTMQVWWPLAKELNEVRCRIAGFVNAEPDEIFFTQSTTDGMNTLAQGLDLKSGDRILTTSEEHPGGLKCWEYYEKYAGAYVDKVQIQVPGNSPQEILKRFRDKITPQTKVLSVSDVLYTTGFQMPLDDLAKLARGKNLLFILDGAQAAGVKKLDFKKIQCDGYAASGHKWMLGPKGSGFLYLNRHSKEKIHPMNLEGDRDHLVDIRGVSPLPALFGLGTAAEFLQEIGQEVIHYRILALSQKLYAELSKLEDTSLKLLSLPPEKQAPSLMTFELPRSLSCRRLVKALYEKDGITVRPIEQNGLNAVRVSVNFFHSEEDIDLLAQAVRRCLKGTVPTGDRLKI